MEKIKKDEKSFFKKDFQERYTEDAVETMMEVKKILYPLFKQKIDEGYSVREIEYIFKVEITDMVLDELVLVRMVEKKEN
jgi:hypothetical protein